MRRTPTDYQRKIYVDCIFWFKLWITSEHDIYILRSTFHLNTPELMISETKKCSHSLVFLYNQTEFMTTKQDLRRPVAGPVA
jgi:hypothetical protein